MAFYVLCDKNCKYESMTKEQILTAITQAINDGEITNVDTGFVTTIKEQNANTGIKFWVGTQAKFNALEEKPQNCLCLFTDDTTLSDIEAELKRIGSIAEENAAAINRLGATVAYDNDSAHATNFYYEKKANGIINAKGKFAFTGTFTNPYGSAYFSPIIELDMINIFSPVINEVKDIFDISASISGTNEFLGVNVTSYDKNKISFYVFSHKEFTEAKTATITFNLLGKC